MLLQCMMGYHWDYYSKLLWITRRSEATKKLLEIMGLFEGNTVISVQFCRDTTL